MEEYEEHVERTSYANSDAEDNDLVEEPLFTLTEGLNLKDLQAGTVFEVDLEESGLSELGLEENSANVFETSFNDEKLLENLNIEDTTGDDSDNELSAFEFLRNKMEPLNEGVYKRVKEKGHGVLVPDKSFVTIHYNNYLEYEAEPFDSSRLRNIPTKFVLNTGAVIPGLDVAIATMQTGEVSQFLISPDYAFGDMGVPPRIPASATIMCEVELIQFVDSADLADMNEMTPEEKKEASFEKKLNACRTKHKIGNNYFKEKLYGKAIVQYRWALKIMENASLANEEEEHQQVNLLLKLHLNMALCFLTLEKTRQSKIHAHRVLDIQQDNTKANYRLGKALTMEGEFKLAKKHLTRALRKEPHNDEIVTELQKVEKLEKQSLDMEKRLCQKMFGQVQTPSTTDVQQEASEEFVKTIEAYLINLKNDDNLNEIPFNCGFTSPEMACIKQIAKNMDLDIQEVFDGTEKTLKVMKPKKLK